MAEPLSFFTPVSYGNLETSKTEKAVAFFDDCFFFGGYKAVVIAPRTSRGSQRVEMQPIRDAKTMLK